MQLTQDTRRTWWLVMLAAWLVCAALVVLHTAAVRDYVAFLNGLGPPRGEVPTPLEQVIPARYADAQMWVRHALAAEEGPTARIRFTDADNAPLGREVHWSSGFTWLLRRAGALQRSRTGETVPASLEHALLWFNAPLLLAVVVLFSGWIGRRAGAAAGLLVALGIVAHTRFYEGFSPVYVDHHGLISAAIFGLVAGALFMGAGWWSAPSPPGARILPESLAAARRAATVSALCGAVGVWLSAASVLPVIALVGMGGLFASMWAGRDARAAGIQFAPTVWQWWGRVGAGWSVLFYLLEYAPSHFGLRLEVNHPLYALAWWGGAEAIAIIAPWWLARTEPLTRLTPRLALPALAVAAPAFVVFVGGTGVFLVGDPFVGQLRHFVAEGMTLPAAVKQFGPQKFAFELIACALFIPTVVLIRRLRGAGRIALGFILFVSGAVALLGGFEIRWWLGASGVQLSLLLALLAVGLRPPARVRWMATGALAALFVMVAGARVSRDRAANARQAVSETDLLQPLYRDLAAAIRRSQPEGDIVLLANPNASAGIGYYGRFKSLGTLFWENAPGLRAAAMLFTARTDAEAAALVRTRGVTHIVMIETGNFIGEYHQLLHPGAAADSAKQTFGFRVLAQEELPDWLQPIPYPVPAVLQGAAKSVAVYKVAFGLPEYERLYHTAIAHAAAGRIEVAQRSLDAAVAAAPGPMHPALWRTGAAASYHFGADALAVRAFRRALQYGDDPSVVSMLGWILATSSDERLRDGAGALALIRPLAQRQPDDPSVLSTVAAAWAELGRFPDAIAAAERALALAQAAGDKAAEPLLEQRLATYRAGRAWRQ
ncbi:MAG TPA: hypothetical protein VM029_00535 [Opitutaceae bacterium]|nr:hypothetical protein [Opitutaceae bacterium]